ncbi:MAG: hypothetical protein OXC48_10015 [Endozoicomonadaceae bacterium]|nr:hypothetical protein [Endozoicomonadaceae bacterium]
MRSLKKILFLSFLFSITGSVFGHITSYVTNNTDSPFLVYWTARGCGGLHDGVTQVCEHQAVNPHKTIHHTFSSTKTNLQVKISTKCVNKGNQYSADLVVECPSGNWTVNGGKSAHFTCNLHGSGRGHVKNVVVNDFNGDQKAVGDCKHW